ncbi:MAG: ubiquinone biosynthesis regulatory protein kinase UbiB [Betaproteobacteria bacterium TMED156]|nr:MAG: ubiquinone biosynthesis regulatory protein kinase UbiB [Betaproteobacteria bacterium TMED156]
MKSIFRLITIMRIIWSHGFDQLHLHEEKEGKKKLFKIIFSLLRFGRKFDTPRAVRLRQGLEALGPIFVKLGQVLSTRRDMLPEDISNELAKLQDKVTPFNSKTAIKIIEQTFEKKLSDLFSFFSDTPVASASIAQVHFAELHDGRKVAVKVLRPGMLHAINKDISLMKFIAVLIENFTTDGQRLRPREVISEFENYLHDELDLVREAANASQLKRNFKNSDLLQIPDMIWEYCKTDVIVMERVYGIQINKVDDLLKANVDLVKLSHDGVEIFFTQVFRDGFFHADMHPGNILVSNTKKRFGKYIALDFGIVGSLTEYDKNYLTQNFLAFFRRDYRKVAELHIESGWVPKETRIESLESAIRSVCEPYFDKPLKDISLGQVLIRLFQASRRFNVKIQPQLVLLQKTLLNVEGLGRQLNPELDLWSTAKPILEKWMKEQVGFVALKNNLSRESEQWAKTIPKIPGLLFQLLNDLASKEKKDNSKSQITEILKEQKKFFNWIKYSIIFLFFFFFVLTGIIFWYLKNV